MGQRIGTGSPFTAANPTVPIALGSGQLYKIPSGNYMVMPGLYTFLQWFDPVLYGWRMCAGASQGGTFPINSDGTNFRLANLTGCMVGASITTAGSGLTNGIYYPSGYAIANNPNAVLQAGTAAAPSVTMSAGGGSVIATCNLIVGGAINSTIAITTAGSGYTRAPILTLTPPPSGGVQATAVCTLTAGAIGAVTVTNQGAGYTSVPTVTVTNSPDDTTGTGAVLTVNATLAGSGGYTAITIANPGSTMNAVPTFTFSPTTGSPAATAIMCFTITTGVAQTGQDHSSTGNLGFSMGALATAQSINTNPAITTGLFQPRMAYTAETTTAGGGITFLDGGLHQIVPIGICYVLQSDGTVPSANTKVAQTVGGAANDISYLLPY